MAVNLGKQVVGNEALDPGDQPLAGGSPEPDAVPRAEAAGDRHGDLEERRETQQVLRSTSDGLGEGMIKDQS
jgi:hypothetical protein